MARLQIEVMGAEFVLYEPDGTSISLSFKLEFPCSNNGAEYEVRTIGLAFTLHMEVRKLRMQGDSGLIIQHNGEFALKEITLLLINCYPEASQICSSI